MTDKDYQRSSQGQLPESSCTIPKHRRNQKIC